MKEDKILFLIFVSRGRSPRADLGNDIVIFTPISVQRLEQFML